MTLHSLNLGARLVPVHRMTVEIASKPRVREATLALLWGMTTDSLPFL